MVKKICIMVLCASFSCGFFCENVFASADEGLPLHRKRSPSPFREGIPLHLKQFPSRLCREGISNVEALSLEESVALALETSENIASFEASRERSRHELSAVRRAAGLNVEWNAGASRIGGSYYRSYRKNYNPGTYDPFSGSYIKTTDPYINEFSNHLTAKFPIYTGGQLEGRMKSAGYQSASADINLERTRQQVRFWTEQAYYTLLQRQNQLNVSKEAAETSEKQLKLIKTQYEEGAAPKADVLQMEVQLASYKQDLITAKGALEAQIYQLARLIGREGEKIALKDTLIYEPFPWTLEEAEAFALLHRPEKAAATLEVKRANADLSVAEAGYKPKVSVRYTRNITDNRPFMRDGRSETWAAGVDLSWNVFDNFITTANVDAAKANVKRAKADELNAKKTALLETRSAYAQMKAAETNIKAAKIAVEQAKESYEIATVRYEEGVDNLLAVTTAGERLIRAETNYNTALYNYNLYKSQLKIAVGWPVLLDVSKFKQSIEKFDGSAKGLDKIEASSMILK